MDWIRLPTWNKQGIFVIWRVVLQTLPTIGNGLTWRIKAGTSVRIGSDPSTSCGNMYRLPLDLIEFLNDRGIFSMAQIVDLENFTIFM